MANAPTSVQRLKQARKEWPEVAVLAEPLALAVRIEPELLRDVRLALLPASHASLEADLYFSPLVSQRTPEWLSVDPPLAHELQKRLAARMRRGGRDEEGVRRVRAMVARAHSIVPFEIAREEQIIWMSVEQSGGKAETRRAVNEVLRDLLMRMLQGSDASVALARWFAGAAKRMPPLARETESFALLVFASSSILGGRKIEAKINATLDTFEALARYLPQSAKRITVWGALTTRGLHLRPEQYPGYQPVEIPLTNPVLLEARPENGSPILVQVSPGQTAFVPLAAGMIALRTLTRDQLTFRPRAATASHAEAVRAEHTRESLHIYISHANADDDDILFVHRLALDLEAIGHFVFLDREPLGVGEQFADRIREEIAQTDCVLVVLTARAAESSWVQAELAFAESSGVPRIHLLRQVDSDVTLTEQSRGSAVDFREPRPYHEAFEELQAELRRQPCDRSARLSEVAALYYNQGQYAKAEPLYQRALEIREKALGPEHPDVATSLNNLAELYRVRGQYAKAEPLYERALAIREKALSSEHPDLAWSLNSLAALYETQGRYAEAQPPYERALAIGKRPWARSMPTWPRASTTWRSSTGPEANTRRPSPSTSAR